MPETVAGRELIKNYLSKHEISITSLAATFGVGKMYMTEVLNGKKKTAAANELVLKIINDFRIRPDNEY